MEDIRAKYKKLMIGSRKTSIRLQKRLVALKEGLEDSINNKLINHKKGYYLPSSATTRILNNYKIVLDANRDLYQCSQMVLSIKELAVIQVSTKASELHNDMRILRDNLKTQFMTDILVMEKIKTIKHQEAAFEVLFQDMLNSYSRGKIAYQNITDLMQFLSDSLYQLSNLGKYLYNYSNMQMQEMAVQEQSMSADIRRSHTKKKVEALSEDSLTSNRKVQRVRGRNKTSNRK